jgi:hypothetical protein
VVAVVLGVIAAGLARGDDTWTNLAPGLDYLYRTAEGPREIHAVVADLTRPEIWLRASREDERSQTPSSFARAVGARVAVNGDLFDYADYRPRGLAVGDGWAWADTVDLDTWSFIACNVTRECWIDPWGSLATLTPRHWNVIGGFQDLLVIDGAVQHYSGGVYEERHPRTAAGFSLDGARFIVAVVDGRSARSIGMTFSEMADLMAELGAGQAIMLDGGGSSSMVIDGTVRNVPSDGSERVVSNYLALMVSGAIDARCAGIENGKYCVDGTRLATCEGGIYAEGDCGAFGCSCEEDGDFAYCVHPSCRAGGQNSFCLDATRIAGCTDGVYGEGDCGFYGAACVGAFGDAWCAFEFYQGELVASSFPAPGAGVVTLEVGETVEGWFDVRNTGRSTWEPGVTKLAPIPRDQPSPLADPSWESPSRTATVAASVPPGATGRFEVVLRGAAEGVVVQSFGLVQEGVTWFADPQLGGGPVDGALAVEVQVVPTGADGDADGDGDGDVDGDVDGDGDGDGDGDAAGDAGIDGAAGGCECAAAGTEPRAGLAIVGRLAP